jgi:uncharacterized protein YkwD
MQYARLALLLFLFLGMSECFIPRLQSQSESTKPPSSDERLIIEKHFETQMLEMINKYRIQKGLEKFVWDESIAEIARDHSREMALQGFISHEVPSGNVSTRIVRAGYYHDGVRENVARSTSIPWTHNALIKSPVHLQNIAATDVSRIGIGIVRAPAPYNMMLYITQVFANPRQMHPASAIREELLSRIDALRQSGVGALASDPLFEKLASSSLNTLPYPYERQELRSLLASSAQKLQEDGRTELSRIDAIVQLVRDPMRLRIPTQNSNKEAAVYGAAIRKVTDSTDQPAFLVMTLVGFTNQPAALTKVASSLVPRPAASTRLPDTRQALAARGDNETASLVFSQ